MKCANCQAPILDDSRFCGKCGKATDPSGDTATRTMVLGSAGGLAPGGVLGGKYRILEVLGRGGMGVVYKAEDTQLGRTVALKVLGERSPQSSADGLRFLREAKASATLDHPNICTVYEIGEQEGQAYLAMAFVEGQTLKQKIAERPMKLGDALEIAIQAGEGLRAAHEREVVHRDIKPGNLMVTPQGRVKVLDFGLAKLTGETQITASGTVVGTPAYMSPEQAKGESLDRRTDIWSLGVVLYEMLSGRTPFAGDSTVTVLRAILNDEPEPVTALRSGLPVAVDGILGKALAKNPEERYQHVEDMLVDLRALERGSTSGTGQQRPVSALRARRSNRRLWWGAGAAAANATYFVMQSGGRGTEQLVKRYHLGWTFVLLWDSLNLRGLDRPVCDSTIVGRALGVWWSLFLRGGARVDSRNGGGVRRAGSHGDLAYGL